MTSPENRDLINFRESAAAKIVRTQQENEQYYNNRRKEASKFDIGDYVMIRNVNTTAGVNKKLIPRFKGPMS